jgi:FkbH-like protein
MTEDRQNKAVKCVVWDLDNTLWHGILLESDAVELRDGITGILRTLDERGILLSVASRNEWEPAIAKLREFGLDHYFLYPQINWNPKSASISEIAKALNIGVDAIAFVDDQEFERDEVRAGVEGARCIDATNLTGFLERPEMNPRFITEDSKVRRLMYLQDGARLRAEQEYTGPREEFLASLGMKFEIGLAGEHDLKRAEELTVRTHQLNTTGYTYSFEELDAFRQSGRHLLFVTSLEDTYGSYGKIGLGLVECGIEEWTIKLLLMSCRVMSRGVGTILLTHIMRRAREAGVRLRAEFVPNGRNRQMLVTYKFAGFKEVERSGQMTVLENDNRHIPDWPGYVQVDVATDCSALAVAY